MRSRQHYSTRQRMPSIQDPDVAGAHIQAFEKHRPIKLLLGQPSRASGHFDHALPLRQVSRFVRQKIERRATSRQLRQFILQIRRNEHTARPSSQTFPSASAIFLVDRRNTPNIDPENLPPLTSRTCPRRWDEPACTDGKNHALLPDMTSPARSDFARDKTTLPRRSTHCGTLTTPLNLVSPGRTDGCIEPPLTPVDQITRTPAHPPRIERHEPRTPYRGQRTLGREDTSLVRLCRLVSRVDFPDTPYNDIGRARAELLRDRPSNRRLSYPHFQIVPSSYSFPPLNMPSLAAAFNGCQDLASPLNIRSPNPTATPCTPQIMKERGPTHHQRSPHCLGCFA